MPTAHLDASVSSFYLIAGTGSWHSSANRPPAFASGARPYPIRKISDTGHTVLVAACSAGDLQVVLAAAAFGSLPGRRVCRPWPRYEAPRVAAARDLAADVLARPDL